MTIIAKEDGMVFLWSPSLIDIMENRASRVSLNEVLLAAFKEQKLSVVAGAYQFFICRDIPNSEDVLIKALNKYGHFGMAEDFINSHNGKLAYAGHVWVGKKARCYSFLCS